MDEKNKYKVKIVEKSSKLSRKLRLEMRIPVLNMLMAYDVLLIAYVN